MKWAVYMAVVSSACATAAPAQRDDDYYAEVVQSLLGQKSGQSSRRLRLEIDYAKFRAGAAARRNVDTHRLAQRLAIANAAANHREALRVAVLLLARDFAAIDAHLTQARALHDAGRACEAGFHDELARRLLESMLDGADGSSGQPFRVVDGREMEMVHAVVKRPGDPARLHFAVLKR